MKTAKEIFEEELSGEPLTQESVIEAIKIVQKEVIDAACKRCSEEAEVDFEPMGWLAEQHMISPFIEGEDYEVVIIRGTILKVAEKMKEELE